MDQSSLVGKEFDDGLSLVNELTRNHFDVTAAFWLKESEDDRWHLYIASGDVDEKGLTDAYRTIHETFRRKPDLWINPFDVRLIGASDPIARDVLAIRDPKPGVPTRYFGPRLGGLSIEEAYIYGSVPIPEKAGA